MTRITSTKIAIDLMELVAQRRDNTPQAQLLRDTRDLLTAIEQAEAGIVQRAQARILSVMIGGQRT